MPRGDLTEQPKKRITTFLRLADERAEFRTRVTIPVEELTKALQTLFDATTQAMEATVCSIAMT